jgi:CRP-like cAMP-binding protein
MDLPIGEGAIMRSRINGEVRERLRQLLLQRARAYGLTPAAVELLLQAAVLERWSVGDEIVTADETGDRTALIVVGAAKVVCETPRGKRVSVCFVAPGHPLPGEWPAEGSPTRHELRAIAHDPLGTVVALWTRRALLEVMATLPPGHAMHAIATTSHTAMEILRRKCDLLGLSLRDRVLAVLQTLAQDFGRPHPDGLRIELRLTHQDVAGAAVGSRANVTRALEELRSDGEVLVEEHRLVVTHRGLAAFHAEGATRPRLAGGWAAAAAAQ